MSKLVKVQLLLSEHVNGNYLNLTKHQRNKGLLMRNNPHHPAETCFLNSKNVISKNDITPFKKQVATLTHQSLTRSLSLIRNK